MLKKFKIHIFHPMSKQSWESIVQEGDEELYNARVRAIQNFNLGYIYTIHGKTFFHNEFLKSCVITIKDVKEGSNLFNGSPKNPYED
jgi:hypothetical protein